MKMTCDFRGLAMCAFVLVALALSNSAAAQSMDVLGGVLSWTTSTTTQPCGGVGGTGANATFNVTQYTNFAFQQGGAPADSLPGSTAYIWGATSWVACPSEGPQGSVGLALPAHDGYGANCDVIFTATSGGGGSTNPQQCNAQSTSTIYTNLECWGQAGYNGYPPAVTEKDSWRDWTLYDGSTTGSYGAGTESFTHGNNLPGTGACGALTIQDTLTSGTEWNVLGVLNACGDSTRYACPSTEPNWLEADLQFVIPSMASGVNYRALEFDPDVTNWTSDHTYTESVQCDFVAGEWKYWDSSIPPGSPTSPWMSFQNIGLGVIPCSLSAGRHSLQLVVSLVDSGSTHTYQYQKLVVDGTTIFNAASNPVSACDTTLPSSQSRCAGFQKYVGVEQQVDNASLNGTVSASYDNYTLWTWNQ